MTAKTDCFVACANAAEAEQTISGLCECLEVGSVVALVPPGADMGENLPAGCSAIAVEGITHSDTIATIARNAQADYALLITKPCKISMGPGAVGRMISAADDSGAAMVYADRYTAEGGNRCPHPTIDYQKGSLRDDFDFGPALLVRTSLLRKYAATAANRPRYRYAGLYDLRLFLSREGSILHLNEYLYTEHRPKARPTGESQFDYVDPANRSVQVEMEQAATAHLGKIGAMIDTAGYRKPDFNEQDFAVEASVVIPVRNRERTILDAVRSALAQETAFAFNVIVVDNHSTDGTTQLLRGVGDPRLIHIVPERTDLGIGGCWNMAIGDSRCGRFAVQLDSDDLYSSPHTLQCIVAAFYEQGAAMVVGSYRICDFNLNTLPPGLIAHTEWTEQNGPNNALRINGLGAPRAFFTPLARQWPFPNTSYGEDYAMGLAFSRSYRVGRIFTELYLCRRWGGNSDASLSIEQANANNLYKDRLRTMELMARKKSAAGVGGGLDGDPLRRFFNRQIETWDTARRNFRNLQDVSIRRLAAESCLLAQFNPARIVSTGASVSKEALGRRPCFLCRENRPGEQSAKSFGAGFEILVNPYPILPLHFTIPSRRHEPQLILEHYAEMHRFLAEYPGMTVFYNGPECGASAPDHMHFQAVAGSALPLQAEWPRLRWRLKNFRWSRSEL